MVEYILYHTSMCLTKVAWDSFGFKLEFNFLFFFKYWDSLDNVSMSFSTLFLRKLSCLLLFLVIDVIQTFVCLFFWTDKTTE